MDWYFGSSGGDLIVPRDQDLLDRLPSPDSWLRWGLHTPESFGSPNKYFVSDADFNQIYANFDGKSEVEMETSVHDKDGSSDSSVYGLSDKSLKRTILSCGGPDYQPYGVAETEQMDDIFMSSLLEDLPRTENLQRSSCFSPESECDMIAADNIWTDMLLDSQSISSDINSMGSSKYLKTHAFSPSVGCEKGEGTASNISPWNLDQNDCPPVKAPLVKVLVHSGNGSTSGHISEEISFEESVLEELEMVMTQLSEKTRICFRDALYRLAKNSNENMVTCSQKVDVVTGKPPWTVYDETIRSGEKKTMESETNTIDRAIANLMFNKMEFNVQDLPVEAPINFKQEVSGGTGSSNYGSNLSEIDNFPHPPSSPNDAEVPVLGQRDHK